MASSSDSGEDFESADEDFDFDHSSKDKAQEKCIGNVTSAQEIESPNKVSETVQRLDSLKLDDDSTVKHQVGDVKESSKVEKFDGTKSKSVKKLGTKLLLNPKPESVLTKDVQKKTEHISEEKLINSDNISKMEKCTEVFNEEHKLIQSLLTGSEEFKKENSLKSGETKLNNSPRGDGWEIEEEDGFEIPSMLAKASDGSIQCSQEQICELDQVEFRPHKEQGWGAWGGWGVGSLLTAATGSVSTFSSQVSAGLSNVLETTVGAPDPETLAAATVSSTKETEDKNIQEGPLNEGDKNSSSYGGFGSIVSGVSFLGSSVINRGLDTLETLGKKTMEVLQEGDPGLKKKRAMLFPNQDKPVLSQILREAKEKADSSDKEKEEKETARKAHFESLFDDFQGMVHLEALEMLSTQCELKLQSLLLDPGQEDLQETMSQVQELCELPVESEDTEVLTRDEFTEQITNCIKGLYVKISATKIIQVNDEIIARLHQLGTDTAAVVNQTAISSLAELTAAGMEFFHKSAELLLAKSLHNTADEAENYVLLTGLLCARISVISNEFTQLLTKTDPIANSSLITNIFLEASNSSSYIRNACQLLVSILQVGAVSQPCS